MATVALSGIITPSNVVTATSTTTLTNKTLTGAVMNGTLGATTPSTVVATTVKASTTMGVGGATPSASGAGITYPATASDSTDANTLDDYEEGTYTCTNSSNANVSAFAISNATYTKIGRLVYVEMHGTMNATNSNLATSGVLSLPFTATSNSVRGGTIARQNYEGAIGSIQQNNTTSCYFLFSAASGVQSGAGASWVVSFFYSV